MGPDQDCIWALVYGLLSAVSLPIGAVVGLTCGPVPKRVTGWMMAFGSGALMHAVTVQLFGESLDSLRNAMDPGCAQEKSFCPTVASASLDSGLQVVSALLGASAYLLMNRIIVQSASAASAPPHRSSDSEMSRSRMDASGSMSRTRLDILASSTQNTQADARDLLGTSAGNIPRGTDVTTLNTEALASAFAARHDLDASAGSFRHQKLQSLELPLRSNVPCESSVGQTSAVAISMWLGVTLDGIPEAFMIGFKTDNGSITASLLLAVFIANFPEAFSAASLLRSKRVSIFRILMMWTSVFVSTGVLAMFGSFVMPDQMDSETVMVRDAIVSIMEGLTGGAMLAMVSTAMLPEAFHDAGEISGLLFVLGFSIAVVVSCLGVRFQ